MNRRSYSPAQWAILALLFFTFLGGILWGFWALWCWVMPQVWPTGPEALIAPGYWLFVGGWLLVSFVGLAMFGHRKGS